MTVHSRIVGTGSYLPPRRWSNADLVADLARHGVESSDDWIVERTGIRARHFADEGVFSSDLAFEACKNALQAANLGPQDIDLIIVATSTPDMIFPSTACILQHKLAQLSPAAAAIAGSPAFDVQAVCAGFIYAMSVADAMIRAGNARRALVVGAEVFSRLLDFKDRTTCVLFGDGAGAVVLEASAQPGVLATDIHADGKHVGLLCVPGHVHGVFKLAVGVLEETARTVLAKAGLQDTDLDWLVPHQANIRIIQSTAKKLKLSMDKVILTVADHGNTSAASIPLALDAGVRAGRVKPGQLLMLEGVGGGFAWGSILLRY
jgi:3-oxoacyl-[acyl-carrier-protein] synthase-3